ncbi:hypothetical protein SRHO_G00023020 [Serrasalmus rhombeus]
MSELHVRTVRSGSNVTIKCDQNMDNDNKNYLSWYKQSSGKVPEYVVRSFQGIRYASGFNDGRFTVDEETFDLTINGKNEEDAGLYFCGKVKANVVEFGSGTHLLYQENNSWIVITLTILNVIFVIVIILLIGLLLKNHRNGTFNSHLSYTDQAEDTKVLNYAALNFAMKPSSSRPPRLSSRTQDEKQDVYSQVKHS